jgi:hypothetical protein
VQRDKTLCIFVWVHRWCCTEELSNLWMTYCTWASQFMMLYYTGTGVPYMRYTVLGTVVLS